MLEWAEYNLHLPHDHERFATATTGHLLIDELGLPVTCFRSAPTAATGRSAPASPRARSTSWSSCGTRWSRIRTTRTLKALLRVAMVCNIPVACNRATADFMISSPLMSRGHDQWDPASSQANYNQAALKVVRTG